MVAAVASGTPRGDRLAASRHAILAKSRSAPPGTVKLTFSTARAHPGPRGGPRHGGRGRAWTERQADDLLAGVLRELDPWSTEIRTLAHLAAHRDR
ncbi:hypothetical protein [Actinophytocola sp.]|uniref:hypothetical protein n=1 Tax=Actinophytocola sp. TaxID=1872138 RepID=UPI00389A3D4C